MNRLTAEGFILHREDGTEEKIVRDVEIRVEENPPIHPGTVYEAENVSHMTAYSPGVLSRGIISSGMQIESIMIGCGVSHDVAALFPFAELPVYITTASGEWNFDRYNPTVPEQPFLITGINAYWTDTTIDFPMFLNRIFQGQMPSIPIEPLEQWDEETNYLSFEELIYTSDDERQFRIKNTQVKNGFGKFSLYCGKNTTISEITRGRSHLFVNLDEEIDGMVKE